MVRSIRIVVAAVVALFIAVVLAALAGLGVLLCRVVEHAAAGDALAMLALAVMFCAFAVWPIVYSLLRGDRDA